MGTAGSITSLMDKSVYYPTAQNGGKNQFSNWLDNLTINALTQMNSMPTMSMGSQGALGNINSIMGMNSLGMTSMSGQNVYSYLGDPNLRELADSIHSSFCAWPLPDKSKRINMVLNKLAQENPAKLAALEIVYGKMYGAPDKLRQDIRHHLCGVQGALGLGKPHCKELDLLNQAAKISPANAAIALHEAMKGAGTDEKTVKDIINNSPDNVLSQVLHQYKYLTGGKSLKDDIKGDFNEYLGGPQEDILTRIDMALAGANSYGIF
ncbi:MAG: hypothetical protein A2287_01940 [Candidatus Melainabacteria bacterium RIFOXYA12_FULL_32_12]|nr:MAG: hypothetical protein A2255_09060 [Candidatus Melainabacteria bacterium RIFOXYA2_FULL_32_9]OGI30372.1 MAG: hypothetical protein A2287_01940 [Candidatus Melainabacteria bacterium RIFOXYA12_FULL_32_12]